MKTIGIFTTFYRYDPAYSLCSVVWDQLYALTKNRYKTVLFVLPSFQDDSMVPKGVEIRKVVPQLILEPYKGTDFPDHWKEDAKKVEEMLAKNAQDIDFLICHDIFFIDTYLPYNIGLRDAVPHLPKLHILAWTHSAPSSRIAFDNNPHANRFIPIPGRLIYLNHDKVTALAEMYAMWPKDVRVVHNSRDPRTFWNLDPLVERIVNEYNLFEADFISIYPLSTPRMVSGKGLDKVVKLHSKLKELDYKTRLIVPNAHANAQKEQRQIAEFKVWSAEQGISHEELVFTSQLGQEYELGVEPKVISDLFRLSNLFIFPTVSENSSLVLLEAMLSGCFLVLNKEVGTLLEHAGSSALYFDFGYKDKKEETEIYYLDLAKIIVSEFEINKSLQVKRRALQHFNYDFMFKQLEHLFYESEN